MAGFIALLSVCKYFIAGKNYKYVLAFLNALFLVAIYPKPYHFFLLLIFSYISTYVISEKIKFNKKIWGILILLLPMLLVKFDIRFGIYPFELNNLLSFAGISYASFRIMGYYMDKAPDEKMPDFTTYFNFLAFTPILLIGPIDKFSRYKISQNKGFENINTENFILGWKAIIKGILFKYILAEVVDRYWLNLYNHESKEVFYQVWL